MSPAVRSVVDFAVGLSLGAGVVLAANWPYKTLYVECMPPSVEGTP